MVFYFYFFSGGETGLTDTYILKLTASIDHLFMQKFGAPPRLVADVYHYNYRLKAGCFI